MNEPAMSMDEYKRITRCFVVWLEVRLEHEPRFRQLLTREPAEIVRKLADDTAHSALLQRMVRRDRAPLPVPPPLDERGQPAYPDL